MDERTPRHLAYQTTHEQIAALAGRPGVERIPIPTCPGWTVRDLVAHVSGHVLRRVGTSTDDVDLAGLLRLWGPAAEHVRDEASAGRADIALLLMDTFTHELDLRAALGEAPPAPEHPGYLWTFDVLLGGFGRSVSERGLPAIAVHTDSGDSWTAGEGEPGVTVRGSRHELARTLAGRRTAEQISALDWSADPRRWLPAFEWGPFRLPEQPVD